MQVPQLFRLRLHGRPVHAVRGPGHQHELHIIPGQRFLKRGHDIHNGRHGFQQLAAVGGSARVSSFREGHGHAQGGDGNKPVHGQGLHLAVVLAAVRGKLVGAFVQAAALHYLNGDFPSGQHVARNHGQGAFGIAHALHRADGTARHKGPLPAAFQFRIVGEQQCGPGFPDDKLLCRGLRRVGKRPASVKRNENRCRAHGPGGFHLDHHVGIDLRHAGNAHVGILPVAARADRFGNVTARLRQAGHGYQHGFLPAGVQHVPCAFRQRSHAQQPFNVGTGAEQVALAHLSPAARSHHNGRTFHAAGRKAGGAVHKIFEHVAHYFLLPPPRWRAVSPARAALYSSSVSILPSAQPMKRHNAACCHEGTR